MKVTGGQKGRNLPDDLQKFKNEQCQKGGHQMERRS